MPKKTETTIPPEWTDEALRQKRDAAKDRPRALRQKQVQLAVGAAFNPAVRAQNLAEWQRIEAECFFSTVEHAAAATGLVVLNDLNQTRQAQALDGEIGQLDARLRRAQSEVDTAPDDIEREARQAGVSAIERLISDRRRKRDSLLHTRTFGDGTANTELDQIETWPSEARARLQGLINQTAERLGSPVQPGDPPLLGGNL